MNPELLQKLTKINNVLEQLVMVHITASVPQAIEKQLAVQAWCISAEVCTTNNHNSQQYMSGRFLFIGP